MLLTNSVMRVKQPGLQVGECNVDHRQVGISSFGVTIKHQGFVRVAQSRQFIVAPPSVGAHNGSLGDVLLHEFREFLGSTAWHEAQPQSAGIDNSLVLLAFLDRYPGAYLDGPNDRRLMVDATPLAFCTTAHKRLIDFDRMLGSDRVALRPHHTGTQLVEHLKRCLVARQSKLALKLERGLAGRLRRHEVSTPEPYRQRRVLSFMTVFAMSDTLAWQTRHLKTTDVRLANREGAPLLPHFVQVNPCGHRRCSSYCAHAASSGNTR